MKRCKKIARVAGAMLLCAALSPGAFAAEPQVERSTAELGGDAGHYTSWDRVGIEGFQSLEAVVTISTIHGKQKDKWGSIARINLDDDTTGEGDPTLFSLVFEANRRTKEITVRIQLGLEQPWKQLPGVFRIDQAIGVTFTRDSATAMLLKIGGETFQLPVDFAVTKVKLVGSGVDVTFDPIVLTRQ